MIKQDAKFIEIAKYYRQKRQEEGIKRLAKSDIILIPIKSLCHDI